MNPNTYDDLYRKPGTRTEPPPDAPGVPATPDAPPPQPFVMRSDEVETSVPPRMPAQYTPPVTASQQVRQKPPVQPKPKKPFSPIPLLLLAGVAFLFLGGIIFLTNTWDMLPDAARALSLLSASVIAFGANVLAERVFKLPKTGLAFYILGCIFLPMAMAGIGAFSLMGEWFSFDGDGANLVWALIFACVAAPALVGQKRYHSAFLAWIGLSCIGASWLFFAAFVTIPMEIDREVAEVVIICMLVLFAAGATAWTEWYLRHKKDTPITKIAIGFLYPTLLVYTLMIMLTGEDIPLAATIMIIMMGALFLNRRFIAGKLHTGIFGFLPCLMTALAQIPELRVIDSYRGKEYFLFMTGSASVLLMSTFWLKKAHPALVNTFSITGMLFAIPTLVAGVFAGSSFEENALYLLCLYGALFISLPFIVFTKKNPLSADTKYFCTYFAILFVTATVCISEEPEAILLTLLLVASALVLLIGAFLGRKLWTLVLAIGACGAVLLRNAENAMVWLVWLCTAGLLAGVIYAHLNKRYLLEKSCAWVGIPFLLSSLGMTFHLIMGSMPTWSLLMAAVTLLYLLETVVFWKHIRSEGTSVYLEVISLMMSLITFIMFVTQDVSGGWGFILLMTILVFTVAFVRKPNNVVSLPYLILAFFTATHLITALDRNHLIDNEGTLQLVQVGCFVLILVVFALMGRLLLPDGFCNIGAGRVQVDFPLLAGVFPVFGAAITIDWYPSVLTSLFLSLYSLLYLGRVKNRRIPAFLASMFGCLTVFFHNVHDPWNILDWLRELDIRTPQILLYLLPMHLFILSLLWILPKACKSGVHIARFCMYCFTMLCLLASSFSFGQVADALILVVFSFAILVGSFTIKRLRWFTLGFAVLFVMTIHLTHSFWRSLHWGIYLFLAGAVLIGIASAYELNARKQAEHPDEPKKKFKPFATWRW